MTDLARVLLPASGWWARRGPDARRLVGELWTAPGRERLARLLAEDGRTADCAPGGVAPAELWLLRVIGTLAELRRSGPTRPAAELREEFVEPWLIDGPPAADPDGGSGGSRRLVLCRRLVEAVAGLTGGWDGAGPDGPLLHQVSLNRPARLAVRRSGLAVKGDAVGRLFEARCDGLTWAVLDDGVDRDHPAFAVRGPDGAVRRGASRVRAAFDFTRIRDLLAEDGWGERTLPAGVARRLRDRPSLRGEVRKSLLSGRDVDWSLVRRAVEVDPGQDDLIASGGGRHGTPVAGVLAADWRSDDPVPPPDAAPLAGLCPDLNLIDLRVIDEHGRGDEFAVMAALQFVRYLNATAHRPVVHGVNVSLAIAHDVTNYACGRTPVCLECERLVGDGVIVVAAAGNEGYAARGGAGSAAGTFGGDYRASSIADPGNAEAVITVGSTHRSSPHSYGVSYFSGRGPTGDGRAKPDLVAPGEKIESCVPGPGLMTLDGTSLAAPHVSGAAALLMARHPEFVGRPARVKEVLCRSATDLGRERYFQGHGMLDVLRALQAA